MDSSRRGLRLSRATMLKLLVSDEGETPRMYRRKSKETAAYLQRECESKLPEGCKIPERLPYEKLR